MTTRTSSPGCDRSRYLGVMQNSIFMMMANHGGGKLTVSALGFLSVAAVWGWIQSAGFMSLRGWQKYISYCHNRLGSLRWVRSLAEELDVFAIRLFGESKEE